MTAGLANNSDSYPQMEGVSSPMRTILIPLDFSEASINAFKYGVGMAARNKSRVVLLHVYKLDMAGGYSLPYMQKEVIQKTEEKVVKQFQDLIDDLDKEISNTINFNNIVCSGETVEEIIRVSRVYHADHIIMGMRGENQMIRKILGGTSLSVVNRTSKPVLLIPYTTSYQPI
ncbi:MAG: universal stress protein, partial [Bacteroidota bacterium]